MSTRNPNLISCKFLCFSPVFHFFPLWTYYNSIDLAQSTTSSNSLRFSMTKSGGRDICAISSRLPHRVRVAAVAILASCSHADVCLQPVANHHTALRLASPSVCIATCILSADGFPANSSTLRPVNMLERCDVAPASGMQPPGMGHTLSPL